jgi:hypothetical protein
MPSDKEIKESGVSVYGTAHLSDPCQLGEIAVVKFYDHVDAIAAARAEAQDGDDFWPSRVRHAEQRGYAQGQRDALAAAMQRVERAYDWSGIDNDAWVSGHQFGTAINKIIAAIKGETE